MPRRTLSPSSNQERSPPRYPEQSRTTTILGAPVPHQDSSSHPVLTEAISAPPQPTYSETILQRPTLAIDLSDLPQQIAQSGPTSPLSRRRSSSSMRNASTTFEAVTPSQTPTGRISKAKKGKRVHACEFPGCGKVCLILLFRASADHGRSSHAPNIDEDMNSITTQILFSDVNNKVVARLFTGPTFFNGIKKDSESIPCKSTQSDVDSDVEGPTLSSSISQHGSFSYSGPPSLMPSAMISSTTESDQKPSSVSIPSLVHPQQNQYNIGEASLNFNGGIYMNPYTPHNDGSYFYGSDGSHSPASESMGHLHRPSISSASSVTNFEPISLSPTMTTSIPSQWIPAISAPPSVLPSNMFEEGQTPYIPVSFLSSKTPFYTEADQSQAVNSIPMQLRELDGDEYTAIQRELSNVPNLIFDDSRPGVSKYLRHDCLEHYWKLFHPTFPIIHKPSFLPNSPPPLLLSALMAIGSFYDTRPDAQQYSIALAEIATKLLRDRKEKITETSRNADLQTVLLLEILEKYTARIAKPNPSSQFRALYASLHKSRQLSTQDPLTLFKSLKGKFSDKELHRTRDFWRKAEEKRRVLFACAILDRQQGEFFAQRPTVVSHGTQRVSNNTLASLNMPCDESLWEVVSNKEWATKAAQIVPQKLNHAIQQYESVSDGSISFFHHQIITVNSSSSQRIDRPSNPEDNRIAVSKIALSQHAYQLAAHTPIHALLVVVGESWHIGKQVQQEKTYDQAKVAVKRWLDIRETQDHFTALFHAIELLRLLLPAEDKDEFLTTNLLHENWIVYLAVLVIWAHDFHCSTQSSVGQSPVISGADRKRKFKTEVLTPPRKRQIIGHPSPATTNGLSTTSSPVMASSLSGPIYDLAASVNNQWMSLNPNINYATWPAYYDNSLTPRTIQQDYQMHYPTTTTAEFPTIGSITRTATNTPLSQASFITGTTIVPTSIPVQDDSIAALRQYLTRNTTSDVKTLSKLDHHNFLFTKGVLEAVRNHKIRSQRLFSGLMNDADNILTRLIDGTAKNLF